MGILLSAMAAAGNSGVESMNQRIQQIGQENLQQKASDLASERDKQQVALQQQKELTILAAQKQAAIDADNQKRYDRAKRIGAALPSVVAPQVDAAYADHDAAVAGKQTGDTPLTKAQQAVIQQTAPAVEASKPDYAAKLATDPENYVKAAIKTGDIDPSTVATLVQAEISARRAEALQKASFAHSEALQGNSQAFTSEENRKSREAMDARSQAAHNLDPQTIETNAKAIAAGQMPPLTGIALRSPSGAQTMARVLEIKPDYSAKDYGTSARAEKNFADGKLGNSVRSFNVSLSHLDTLSGLADALKNGNTQMLNKLGNMVSSQMGAPAPTNFEAVKHIVADEIVKAVTGSAGALGDREAAAKVIDAANSPEQLRGVINNYKELMKGQLHGLRDQYKATTGKDDFDSKYLSEAARATMGGNHAQTVPNPMQPSSGGALTYDPKTGTFH